MRYKRAIQYGIMLWVLIFFIFSLILFLPFLRGRDLVQHIIFWVTLIPIVSFLAKWYFKAEEPTWRRGLALGVVAILVATVFDLSFIHFFFPGTYQDFLRAFYGNWKLYVGLVEVVFLCVLSGLEFDATFSKRR